MNTQKFLVSGIVGGLISFLGGYLVYGLIMMDFFAKNTGTATNVMKAPADLIWWAMISGSICFGLLMSYIFNKWANINSVGAGASAGFVISLIMTAGYDLMMYGNTNISNLTGTVGDIICGGVMGAMTGAAVGLMNGLSKKTSKP